MQPDLLRHALPEWRKNGKNIQQEADTLWRIFEAAFSDDAFCSTICVIDALDESRPSDQAKLIKLLANFYTQSQSQNRPNWIKFFVTSRPYLEIQEGFRTAINLFPRIHIRGEEENEQIHDEINLIIKLRVRELGQIEGLETQMLQRIESQLLQMEHRTYLWLQLAMDDIRIMLRDSLRPEEERIQLIPSSVDAAYEKILTRARPARQPEVKMILQIIVGTRRPLKIEEMAVALGVGLELASSADLRSAATSGLKVEGFAEKIRHLCGLFVFIDKSKRIFLIHQTAREFLINTSINDERIPAEPNLQFKAVVSDRARKWYHTTLIEANFLLFKICLAYLTAEEFNDGGRPVYSKYHGGLLNTIRLGFRRLFSRCLFLDYSLTEWENHAVASYSGPPDDLLDLAIKLNFVPMLRDIWLMRAVENGQKGIVKMLLENGADVNTQGWSGQTLLSWAVRGRQKEIAMLLLENGANTEIPDSLGQTPLWSAAQLGEAEIVKLLVITGAEINTIGGLQRRTTVEEAVFSNEESMVKLLIELGADINFSGRKKSMTPLQQAISVNEESMVKLLIELGIDVNAMGGRKDMTALQQAVSLNKESMVKLLIELGADVNALGGRQAKTALQEAVFRNFKPMAKLLIELGADIELKGKGYCASALWIAADQGLVDMVKLLIKLGANIDAKGGRRGLTPLSRAATKNREEMVKLLIELHADIESKDERFGMPPLWWAVARGNEDIVKLLVKMGADTKFKNKQGSTIFSWAADLDGREKMIELLVELGCTDGQE
ncbi:ANK_REP_REGION domain-containing protein [Trichoderma simmonsii]|uniref:ANK_REP_REGION domain-containing protein n=1 Tax=Trichoderma simmonsii TaxID=1491479 RepID=A0A8G0PAD9_9HYPO|nr:ANK_REP_REGION domain-containing protein [Trichoderma simmonsii]